MTGRKAWEIIAPILGDRMEEADPDDKDNLLNVAYVVAFDALHEYDRVRQEIVKEISNK